LSSFTIFSNYLTKRFTIASYSFVVARAFASETELEDFMMTDESVFVAIVFMVPDDADSLPENITYKIRLRSDKWYSGLNDDGQEVAFWKDVDWRTDTIFPDLRWPGPRVLYDKYGGDDPGIVICKYYS